MRGSVRFSLSLLAWPKVAIIDLNHLAPQGVEAGVAHLAGRQRQPGSLSLQLSMPVATPNRPGAAVFEHRRVYTA